MSTDPAAALTDALFDAAGAALCLLDASGRVVRANAAWLDALGFSIAEVAGRDIWELFPASPPAVRALHDRVRAGETIDVPRHRQVVGGRERWFEGRLTPVALPGGPGILITARDVAGVESIASELAAIVEGTDAAIISTDLDGRILTWNPAAERLLGHTAGEAIGTSVHLIIPPERHDEEVAIVAAIRDGQRFAPFDTQRVRKDGSRVDVSVTVSPVRGYGGRITGASKILRDITEHKRAVAALRESEQRLRFALDAAAFGTFDFDVRSGRARWDEQLRRIWGLGPDDQPDVEAALARVHPDDRERARTSFEAALAPGSGGSYRSEYRIVWPDGSVHWSRAQGRVYFEGEGEARRAVRVAGVEADITESKEVEQAMRAALARLRVHIETTPLALVEWDAEYRVVAFSRRAEEVLGWSAGEVVGKGIDEIPWIPEEDWPAVRALMRDMSTGARPSNVNANRNVRKDGSVVYCEWYSSTLRDDAGRLVSVLSLVLDVTERRRAEDALRASEERLALTLEAAQVGTWEFDPTANRAEWSVLCRKLLGVAGEGPVTYERFMEAIHPDDRGAVQAAVSRAVHPAGAGVYSVQYRVSWPDGSTHWIAAQGRAYFEERGGARVPVRMVGTVMDVTAQKQAELDLREADRRKDEFLAMLSHELRNPLAPMRNSLVVMNGVEPSAPQAQRAREVLNRQLGHLSRMVDDLLDVTRIARGKVTVQRTELDLGDLVARAAEDHGAMMHERELDFVVEVPPQPLPVLGDATRLTQVIGNLLHNAAKFTLPGGRVTLSLRSVGSRAEIRVRDTGVGIAPQLLPELFQPFAQGAQSLARTEGGLGLGLAVVKGIVELHGGTVQATSAGEGRGAEFTVTVPRLSGLAVAGPRRKAMDMGARHRVLVIDDNHDAADSLAEIIRLLGHEVDVAYDGPSALEKVETRHPDLVLCDIGLPGMSGYEVAQAVRLRHGGTIRLFAVTGYARPEDVKRAVQAGFDGHLPKPPDVARIERLLA